MRNNKFFQSVKDPLKSMVEGLGSEFPYVSVLVTDCNGKSYGVHKRGGSIESNMISERGAVIKIHNGINYSELSFNDLSEAGLKAAEESIRKDLMDMVKTSKEKLTLREYKVLEEEKLNETFKKDVEKEPSAFTDEELMKKLNNLKDEGLSYSKELIDFRANYQYLNVNKMFLSKNKELEQSYMWSNGSMIAIAMREGNNKYYFKSHSGLKGVELIEDMEQDVKSVVDTTLELLGSEPMIPGEYEVICTPEVSGLIAHEAFGHGIEMDMFLKDRAKAAEYIGEYVASELVTMHDGAKGVEQTSSYNFDDEGILAKDTIIIDRGILKTGMADSLTALSLGIAPTGNGKRESFERKTYTRMTNTYFAKGESTLEEMVASIKDGLLLDGVMSGMEDPKNWGIQCMISMAREIKDGKFTGKIFSPVILTGYVPDLLKSISMVSNDLGLEGAGFCGKGYKEWVKVSSGGPYIKAKVRLG